MSIDELCGERFIARLQAGDDIAFADLVETMGGRMRRALEIQLGLCHEDAEEVTFACLMKLREKGSLRTFAFDGPAKLSTWLITVVLNAGRDFKRHQQTEFNAKAAVVASEAGDGDAVSRSDRQTYLDWCRHREDSPDRVTNVESDGETERLTVLYDVLDTLGEKDQTVLRLHTFLDYSFDEISKIENEPVQRLKTRHFRAMEKLNSGLLKKKNEYE